MDDVLRESAFIRGKHVDAFEAKLNRTLHLDGHVVGCGNGTDALALALRALSDPDFDAHCSAELAALADAPELPSHGGRMDVLSPSESLFACIHHGLPEA